VRRFEGKVASNRSRGLQYATPKGKMLYLENFTHLGEVCVTRASCTVSRATDGSAQPFNKRLVDLDKVRGYEGF